MSDLPTKPTRRRLHLNEHLADLQPIFAQDGSSGVLLGLNDLDHGIGAVWYPTITQGHALTFGTSRQGGKGTTTIIPALLTYAGSMVVIDPKGENAWITAERRRQLGQRVVIIDPWGEVNRRYGKAAGIKEHVTRFNPLSSLRPDSPEFSEEIAAIADALIIPSGNDPHWSESAAELVAGLIALEVEDKPGMASLRTVRHLLTTADDVLAQIVANVVKEKPDSLAARKLGRFTKATTEVASIRSTAMTQTAILDSVALLDGMETDVNPFELHSIARDRVTVYLVIPPDRLQTHGRWLRMILTLFIRAVSRQDRPPALPVMFMVDEAGTLNPVKGGGLKVLEQAFGLLAGLGVVCWMFFQDLNQLKRDYPDSWETFIANSAVLQFLNARDNSTSSYVSEYMGDVVLTEIILIWETIRETKDASSLDEISQWGHAASKTLGGYKLRMLPQNQQIIIYPGHGVVRVKKNSYFAENRFKGWYRQNPYFSLEKQQARPMLEVQSVDEAATFLRKTGYLLRPPGPRDFGWKVTPPGRPQLLCGTDDDLIALAQRVRKLSIA